MYIKLFKLIGKLIYVYTLLFSYSLYYKIEDYFIVRDRDDIKSNEEYEPMNTMYDAEPITNTPPTEKTETDEPWGDNWPHVAYSLHHQNKKEGNK